MKFLRRIANWLRSIVARYEGATYSPQRSYIPGALTSPRFDCTAHSRQEIARKVRYFEKNNPLVQALCGKFENFVVGANPQLTPQSSDAAWNMRAKAWWDEWCLYCDLTSRQTFGCLLNLVARAWFIDGDVFIILTQGEMRNGKSYPRIQLVEGHLCRTPPALAEDPMVVDGVRIDKRGRPVGYYFAEERKSGEFTFGPMRPAEEVIHVFEPSRPGQMRGMSFFHAVINELHDLDDLHILEMQAARENAAVREWIKTATGELPSSEQRRLMRFSGTQAVTTNTGASGTEARSEYYRTITGGTARVLMQGDEVSQNPGQRPSVTTVEYWKLKRELVCAGVEIPYCIVFPDSMQGTVYRGALDMATSYFRSRHAVIADVQRRIWSYVMSFGVATERGLASPPGNWRVVSILPPRAPNVDVGRNSAAQLAELAVGATNYDLIYGPLGLDWRAELRKKAEAAKYIRDLANEFGLTPAEISEQSMPAPGSPPSSGSYEDGEEEEGEEIPIRRKQPSER